MIFGNYIPSTSSYCTIHKFIVIRIFLNQIEIKIYGYEYSIRITKIASMIYLAVSSLVKRFNISSYSFNMEVVTHKRLVPSKKLSQIRRYGLLGDILCIRQLVSNTILSIRPYFFNIVCKS